MDYKGKKSGYLKFDIAFLIKKFIFLNIKLT